MPVKGKVATDGIEISGPWKVTLKHVNGQKHALPLSKLKELSEDEELRSFAGVIQYENVMEIASSGEKVLLDLGKVHGVSELVVNGKAIGNRWYGNHIFDITEATVSGDNTVQISITTTLGNYLKSSVDNPTGQRWTGRQPYYPMGLIGPVKIGQ